MRRVYGLFLLAVMIILVSGYVSAVPTAHYDRPCDTPKDLCTWTTDISGLTNNPLPLGSGSPSDYKCELGWNTLWNVGTETEPTYATATCVFDGSSFNDLMLYISVDNDIISCTLTNAENPNGVEVLGYQKHDGCAPIDPRNGYSAALSPIAGTNTLVCKVADRGGISHFDACVTGTSTIPAAPEFGPIIGLTTLLGALGLFFYVRKK
jgi:hypothetical protein